MLQIAIEFLEMQKLVQSNVTKEGQMDGWMLYDISGQDGLRRTSHDLRNSLAENV